MDEFKFDELKNFEVPESWIENALKLTPEDKKPKRAGLYRYAAGIAACVVLAAAIGFSMFFGFNKNIKLTDPGSGTPNDIIIADSTVDTAGDSENPSVPSNKIPDSTQNGTVITEPDENSTDKVKKSNQNQQSTTQSNAKNKTAQTPTDGEKQTGTPENNKTETEPEEEPQTEKNAEATTDDFWHSHQGEFGAGGDYKPRPTETEAYGCHFVTSVERSAAQGNTYYCRIEDGSGNTLGSGTAQKYDWGNPKWPLDLKYTADFVMYYGETYTVTFYSSNGNTVWSGSVYLKEHQTDYILY